MRSVTLCLPYYLNPGMLTAQLDAIAALPAEIRDRLCVCVVDDGSPHSEARGRAIGCPFTIYRIDVDIRWNQDAAKNIAARESSTPWLLLTDIDHLVPRETWEAIFSKKLEQKVVYRFQRQTLEADGKLTLYKPHPNSWLIWRALFTGFGGYDERFAGYYGSDADFRDRVHANAIVGFIDAPLTRVPRTTIADASTTTYVRKELGIDDVGMARVKRERALLRNPQPLNFRQAYRRVFECSL